MTAFDAYDWPAIGRLLGGTAGVSSPGEVRLYLAPAGAKGGRVLILTDNGGEIGLYELRRACASDVAYDGRRSPGPVTLAARLRAALDGRRVDYDEDLDREEVVR